MINHETNWNVLQQTVDHLTTAEKLQLIEQTARSLRTPAVSPKSGDRPAALDRLRHELATLPGCNRDNGFSNRDHDDELYGGPS